MSNSVSAWRSICRRYHMGGTFGMTPDWDYE
jgi:hypothetical protein